MDIALKQRLVGATVLIALAVVVLPMLLGGRPESGTAKTTRIEIAEPPQETQFGTRRFPVAAEPSAAAPADGSATPLELPAPARPAPQEPATVGDADPAAVGHSDAGQPPVTAAGSESQPGDGPGAAEQGATVATAEPPVAAPSAPAPESSEPAPSATGGRYVVQVASFGSVDNARKLATQLGGLGYAVLNDTVRSDVGTLHRVRVGPYATEAEAAQAVTRLRQQVEGSKPRLMDLQPERAERVTEPSDPLVRWVVQVGSFSSEANADSLVAKLRLEGLSAYREQVGSGASVIYRVRVGPFVERDEAIRADRLVNERLSLDGVVMSAD